MELGPFPEPGPLSPLLAACLAAARREIQTEREALRGLAPLNRDKPTVVLLTILLAQPLCVPGNLVLGPSPDCGMRPASS